MIVLSVLKVTCRFTWTPRFIVNPPPHAPHFSGSVVRCGAKKLDIAAGEKVCTFIACLGNFDFNYNLIGS